MGSIALSDLQIDVLPDLTRPRVVIITECPGLAPEEVETLVTFPLESVLIGANQVQSVRSSSDIGLSVIYAEFEWDADNYTSRQIVQERIATKLNELPPGVKPRIGPISSMLGQIMLIGMWEDGKQANYDNLKLRSYADWVVRKRLLSIPSISEVITMGCGKKQYHVVINPHALHSYDVSLHEVELALANGNLNVTGGYTEKGSQELIVRGIGRVQTIPDIKNIVVKSGTKRSVLIQDVGEVVERPQVKRGDSSINGSAGVVITIQKKPSSDTRKLTDEIKQAIKELQASMPAGMNIATTYEQREFIDRSVHNVIEAVRDAAILVVIVLFIFLFNLRTTFITLTAIPLSILTTTYIFPMDGSFHKCNDIGGAGSCDGRTG